MNGSLSMIDSNNPEMREVLRIAEKAAVSNATILIGGETGTGKEMLACCIHKWSSRSDNPFVAVNCGAMNESLLESELFGHEKGAFTGADGRHPGFFEQAHKGTLFLDEICDVSPLVQCRLLRAIQEKVIRRIGGREEIKVDVRILTATNRDIDSMRKKGLFRDDLFYRLNVIRLNLLPLRERGEDIADLVAHFIRAANREHGRNVYAISTEAMATIKSYDWPGNIRELSHVIERAVVLAPSAEITVEDLAIETSSRRPATKLSATDDMPAFDLPEGGMDIRDAFRQIERRWLIQALGLADGNRSKAAVLLELKRTTLVEKLRIHGIA